MNDTDEQNHWFQLLQQLDTNDVCSDILQNLNPEPLGTFLNIIPENESNENTTNPSFPSSPSYNSSTQSTNKLKVTSININEDDIDKLLNKYDDESEMKKPLNSYNTIPEKKKIEKSSTNSLSSISNNISVEKENDSYEEFKNILNDINSSNNITNNNVNTNISGNLTNISNNSNISSSYTSDNIIDDNDNDDNDSTIFEEVDVWDSQISDSVKETIKNNLIFHKYDEEIVETKENFDEPPPSKLNMITNYATSLLSPNPSKNNNSTTTLMVPPSGLNKTNEIIGNIVYSTKNIVAKYLSEFNTKLYSSVYISSLIGYYYESTSYIKDKSHLLKDLYVEAVYSDDPEILHRNKIRNISKIEHILTRYSLATLSYHDRQLIKETFDATSHENYSKMLSKYYDNSSSKESNIIKSNIPKEKLILENNTIRDILEYEAHSKKKNETSLVKKKINEKLDDDDDEDEDDELIYILSRYFTPPSFLETNSCYICSRVFNFSCLRHHCRYCGQSVCDSHSRSRRPIYRYGMVTPVRVCYNCRNLIDELHRWDELVWKDSRVAAYLNNELILYTNSPHDRGIDKAIRVADYSLLLAKNTLSLTYPTKVVLETVEVFRKFGLTGFAGLMLRKDFMEGIETLKTLVNMEEVFEMSIHELTACAYYKLAIDRGLRGCRPDLEWELHQNNENRYWLKDEEKYLCKDVNPRDLNDAILYAPIALNTVYNDDPVEMQRLASLQDLELIYTNVKYVDFIADLPRFALFGVKREYILDPSKSKNGPLKKEIILAIRGTKTIQDIVTDIRSSPVPFPPSQDIIDSCLNGSAKYNTKPMENEEFENIQTPNFNNLWLLDSVGSEFYTCKGFLEAALNILRLVGPSLVRLSNEGYSIKIVGHSLGGAVAALLAAILKNTFENIHAYCYGCPSIVDRVTSYNMKEFVTCVVLHDDIVSRITPQSIRKLLREMALFRSQIFHHLEQDFNDVLKRSEKLWAPLYRESTLNSNNENENSGNLLINFPASVSFPSIDPKRLVDSEEDYVDLGDEDNQLVSLFIPGKIIHIYFYRGQYRASEVSCNFPSLRRIDLQGNMLDDHRGNNIMNSLLECKLVNNSYSYPPNWSTFNSSPVCMNCSSKFTWHSTFKGEMNEYKERYNCRSCGALVCGPCSENFFPIPKYGMIFPKRICDKCVYNSSYI